MRAKEAPLLRPLSLLPYPGTNQRKIKSSPVDSSQGIHGRAFAYPLFRGGISRGESALGLFLPVCYNLIDDRLNGLSQPLIDQLLVFLMLLG